jgi:hypothetical protein
VYHLIVEVFPLVGGEQKVDGFIFEFGSASEDIKVFYLIMVWKPLKDIVLGNFVSCLSVVPTIILFRDNLILKQGKQSLCS